MARSQPILAVTIAPKASDDLEGIYRYNAGLRSPRQAEAYEALLTGRIYALKNSYSRGKDVEGKPGLRYIIIKRRNRPDGHIAVYRVDEPARTVRVLHVFHTKQDWQNKL